MFHFLFLVLVWGAVLLVLAGRVLESLKLRLCSLLKNTFNTAENAKCLNAKLDVSLPMFLVLVWGAVLLVLAGRGLARVLVFRRVRVLRTDPMLVLPPRRDVIIRLPILLKHNFVKNPHFYENFFLEDLYHFSRSNHQTL